ncbi:MAG: hypothetical protein ACRCZF_13185 [Gemmataceae bacterium]
MNKFFLATVLAIIGTALEARAGGCSGPFCNNPQQQQTQGIFGRFFGKQPLPAFQAAPWYLYWPYNSHFQTPAPLQGAYYGAPNMGGHSGNPYFPAQGMPYGGN